MIEVTRIPKPNNIKTRLADEPGFLDKFVEIYSLNRCRFYMACEQLGVSTNTIREARLTKPDFDAALEKQERLLAEQVEAGLVDEALNPDGNIVAKIFYLKNNWKEKYGEKQVIDVQPGQLWFESRPIEQPALEAPKKEE